MAASRLAQLGKDSVVYGLGAVLAKGIGFLLLPVLTRIFTPAEFGAIEMLATIAALLSAVMVMGMDSAQSFYFFEQRDRGHEAQAELVSAILQWRLIGGGAISRSFPGPVTSGAEKALMLTPAAPSTAATEASTPGLLCPLTTNCVVVGIGSSPSAESVNQPV